MSDSAETMRERECSPDEVEAIAETIWRAEYRIGVNNLKAVTWSKVSYNNREHYRSIAAAILAMQAERRGEPSMHPNGLLEVVYTNYRGETAVRRIVPKSIRFGSTEWHPDPQWLLLAFDLDKKADREFALKDVGSKQPAPIAGLEPVAWRFTRRSVWHVTSERRWAEAHGDRVEPLYTRAQLEAHAAEQVRAERRGDNTIQRDKIYRAAERSNTRFGQWMPERWVNIFVEEMSK